MNNSLKIGIVAGIIAGIVSGIVLTIFSGIAESLGFYGPDGGYYILNALYINVLLGIIFGIIGGIIYSKVRTLIPVKAVLKGLFFGLFLFCIIDGRDVFFGAAYGFEVRGQLFHGFFRWLAYGIVLGFFYEFLSSRYHHIKDIIKIKTYDVIGGFFPGAIAGLVGGIGASFANVVGLAIIGFFKIPGFPAAPTLDMWISQAGSHTVINLFWGTIFGIIFTRVYNLFPRKGVLKGIIYSLTIFLLNSFQLGIYWFGWGLNDPSIREVAIYIGEWTIFVGFFNAFFFGLVLGLLYRKPTK